MTAMRMAWTLGYFGLMLAMWRVMIVAMMLPSAAPAILVFATIAREKLSRDRASYPAAIFAVGYLAGWGGFSLVAMGMQWGLERLMLLSPMMQSSSVYFGSALLIAAGFYQLSPLKHACLRHCRSPLHFLANRYRPGNSRAFQMGLEQASSASAVAGC